MRRECEGHIAPAGDGGLPAVTILHTRHGEYALCLLCAPDARVASTDRTQSMAAPPMPTSEAEWSVHWAFYQLAIAQRDAAWRTIERLTAEEPG